MGAADLPLVRRVLDTVRADRPTVTVVGDVILDRWSVGEAERLTREAPVPVVRVTDTIDVPGGAANTAVNLAALGASVRMVALVGDDAAGDAIRALLADAGVDVEHVVQVAGARTTTKTRIVGGDRIMVRVDDEAAAPTRDDRARLAEAAAAALDDADALVLCDYSLGLDPDLLAPVVAQRRPGTVVLDAHEVARWSALRPDLITPNHGEAERLLGRSLGHGMQRAQLVHDARDEILDRSGARAAVVTLDRDGTVVLDATDASGGSNRLRDAGSAPVRTRAVPASEQQASGAGDTFCAAVTLALASDSSLLDAARFAQAAADVVVRETGTSVCTDQALVASVEAPLASVVDHDELADAIERAREDGRRVVFTNGCFDVVHRGHTTYLRQARALGDLLVVAVNDDDSVRRLKGPERPINTAEDRAGVLAALSSVDLVTVFPTDTPIPLLERVRPDVYVKGGDYSPEMLAETEVVRRNGGEVVMVDYVPEHSTSAVVRRIRDASRP